MDIKSGEFFKGARRSGLWPDAEDIHRSGLTKARKKIPWTVFRETLGKAVHLAYSLWPRSSSFLWHGMSVVAFDGSKYDLPATEEIRKEFDPNSGFEHEGRGHYPQCLVTTAYDVFRHLPIARSIVSIHGSEREQAVSLLPAIQAGCVLLFDRGYPSYELIAYLRERYDGYFLFRSPAQSTFAAVEAFLSGRQEEGYIVISPTSSYLGKLNGKEKKKAKAIQLRIIKLVSPDGLSRRF